MPAPEVGVTPDCKGGGEDLKLEFPKGLSEAECPLARTLVADFPDFLAQQLLDELAGRLEAGVIQLAPFYLRGLVGRARGGAFTPEAALGVAERRKRRRQSEAALQQAQARRNISLPLDERVKDHLLLRRLAAIRNRSREGGGQ